MSPANMAGMRLFTASLMVCALAGTAQALPVSHALTFTPSAQVTLEGSATASGLKLKPRATAAGSTLDVTDLSVAIDGVSAPVTRQADGSWYASRGKTSGAGRLEVFVSHDGIREVLSTTLPPPVAGNAAEGGSMLRDHKQMAWWILNIGIVLIAAIAISRRMG